MASLNITDIQHPVFCQPGKQGCSETDQGLQAPAEPGDPTVLANPTQPGEPTLSPDGISDVTPEQTPEAQEYQPSVTAQEAGAQEAGCVEGRHGHEVGNGNTEVGTNQLHWEDGSPLVDHNINAEKEATKSRLPFQSGGGEPWAMGSTVAVSATAVSDDETLAPSSQPVEKSA